MQLECLLPSVITPAAGMTYFEWMMAVGSGDTRCVPARCCGTDIWYESPGDQWCPEHRCSCGDPLWFPLFPRSVHSGRMQPALFPAFAGNNRNAWVMLLFTYLKADHFVIPSAEVVWVMVGHSAGSKPRKSGKR